MVSFFFKKKRIINGGKSSFELRKDSGNNFSSTVYQGSMGDDKFDFQENEISTFDLLTKGGALLGKEWNVRKIII